MRSRAGDGQAERPAMKSGRRRKRVDDAPRVISVSCNCPLSIRFSCLLKIVFRPVAAQSARPLIQCVSSWPRLCVRSEPGAGWRPFRKRSRRPPGASCDKSALRDGEGQTACRSDSVRNGAAPERLTCRLRRQMGRVLIAVSRKARQMLACPRVRTARGCAFDGMHLAHELRQHRGLTTARPALDFSTRVGARSSQAAAIMRATTQGWEMVCEWPMGSAASS